MKYKLAIATKGLIVKTTNSYFNVYWIICSISKKNKLFLADYHHKYSRYIQKAKKFYDKENAKITAYYMTKISRANTIWKIWRITEQSCIVDTHFQA